MYSLDPKEHIAIIIFTVRTLDIGTEQIIVTSKNLLLKTPIIFLSVKKERNLILILFLVYSSLVSNTKGFQPKFIIL